VNRVQFPDCFAGVTPAGHLGPALAQSAEAWPVDEFDEANRFGQIEFKPADLILEEPAQRAS
jgi:hypothetical protein